MSAEVSRRKRVPAIAILSGVVVIAVSVFAVRDWALHERFETHVTGALDRAIQLAQTRRYEASLAELNALPEDMRADWRVSYHRASALMNLKRFEESAALFEESLSVKPDEPATLFALGVVNYKLGRLELAKAYFAAVVELDPGNEEAKGLMDIMSSLIFRRRSDGQIEEGPDISIESGQSR